MKGVAKIKGPKNPVVGKEATYEVVEFHKGTVVIDPSTIKWKVFKKKDGKWEEAKGNDKSGKKVTFNFSQRSYGKEILVEAFLFDPEVKSPPGMLVKPVMGPKKITNTEILNAQGSAITKTPKYGESIMLKVTTENMVGDTLQLSLWERDTLSDKGHDPEGNTKLWSGVSKKVDEKGEAKQIIQLTPALMALANKGMFEGGEHEYYLLVEADAMQTISKTTQVSNETVLSPNAPAKKPAPKETPKTQEPSLIDQIALKIKDAIGWDKPKVGGTTDATVNNGEGGKNETCGEKYCIKKGDKSELIREINIRLAGFGGNVPTDEFTDRTEKMIKQFQRDYMKVPETGKVCGNVLLAINDFQAKYVFNFESLKCKCGTCSGFGDNSNKGKYLNDKNNIEAFHRYEYPGIHRSLLWSLRAVLFYLQKDGNFGFNKISSGYRCHNHEEYLKKPTTNHMGKALDIHFNDKKGQRTRVTKDMESIRDNIYNKYLGAKWDWKDEKNIFYLESTAVGATTWVHYDVREFSSVHLDDKFFAKTLEAFNGKNIIELAKTSGALKTCMCVASKAVVIPKSNPTNNSCFCDRDFTSKDLVSLGISKANADKFLEAINETITNYKINSCKRKLHFLAQVRHESGEFVYQQEIASGSAYEGRKDLGNTETGDGVRFKGRGLIQITGRKNYNSYGTYKGLDFTKEPENKKMGDLPYCVDSAGWYWSKNLSVDLNDFADKDDIIYISYRVNGGFNGYIDDRKPKLIEMIKAINCDKTKFENYDEYSIKKSKAWDGHDAVYKYANLNTSESKDCFKRFLELTDDYLTWSSMKGDKNKKNKENMESRRKKADEKSK